MKSSSAWNNNKNCEGFLFHTGCNIFCEIVAPPNRTRWSFFQKWTIPANYLGSFLPVLSLLLHKSPSFSLMSCRCCIISTGRSGIWPLTWGSIAVIDWLRPPANHPVRGCWVMNTAAPRTHRHSSCSISIYMEWLEMVRDEDRGSWSGAAADDKHKDDFDHV